MQVSQAEVDRADRDRRLLLTAQRFRVDLELLQFRYISIS